jgi:peptidoglycan/xylan/chitin deacetylase (PgdA/CDA1 family)
MTGFLTRVSNRARDVLFAPPFDSYWRHRLAGKTMCLLYHRVAQPGDVPFLDRFGTPPTPPECLEGELRFLLAHGARPMTFADLRAGRAPGTGEFGLMVSFDDGFRDCYDSALPIVASLGMQGTVFQCTALLDAQTLIWEHALYWLCHHDGFRSAVVEHAGRHVAGAGMMDIGMLVARLRDHHPVSEVEALVADVVSRTDARFPMSEAAAALYPTASHLHAVQSAGHEIGSHGHRHYPRRSIDAAEFEMELSRSAAILAQVLGKKPLAFSYPFNSRQPGDDAISGRHFEQAAIVDGEFIDRRTAPLQIPRFTWTGPHRNALRRRRWLWTGRI